MLQLLEVLDDLFPQMALWGLTSMALRTLARPGIYRGLVGAPEQRYYT